MSNETAISAVNLDYGTGYITYSLSGAHNVKLGATVVITGTSATEIKYDGIDTMEDSTSAGASVSGARFDNILPNPTNEEGNTWGHDAMLGI